jgi:hypothetical protein
MLRSLIISLFLCGISLINWMHLALAQNMAALTDEVKPKVAVLRDLSFLQDVEKAVQSPAELQQFLLKDLERTYPGETLHILEKRLLKFGFMVSPLDLHQMMTQMFSQQVAGYYDPRAKKMVLINAITGSGGQRQFAPVELLARMLAAQMGVSLEKMILAHELTHVVQDQHFNLLALPFEALDPEDTTSAVRALIEGDAMLVMIDYVLVQQGTDSVNVPGIENAMREWVHSPLVRGLNLVQFIPRYFTDNLLFSYIDGYNFVLQLKRRSGWEKVNQAYHDFPVSTEQILHPEKYFKHRDLPTTIKLPTMPRPFPEWQLLEQNTLGEFNISILIDGYLPTEPARVASEGWGGDRFALYENSETGQQLLAWYTTWDTEQDAREFFQVYTDVIRKRYKNVAPENLLDPTLQENRVWKINNTDDIYLEIRGTDVLLLDGVPDYYLEYYIPLFWSSQKVGSRQ